jgi:hypothetical protein
MNDSKKPNTENQVNVTIDKVIIKGGHDVPPDKKKKKKDGKIPINEHDVEGMTYIEE